MSEVNADFFHYFAYGSNLLAERIHVQIKGAQFVCVGRLADYELFFAGESERWRGAAASIRPKQGHDVWGCVWKVPNSFASELDAQEHWYDRRTVSIETSQGPIDCRTYEMKPQVEGEPSPHYKAVIVNGAKEHALPAAYIKKLEGIKENGYTGQVDVPISFLSSLFPAPFQE